MVFAARLIALALLLCSSTACAVGVAQSNGAAWGVAFGQAEIRACDVEGIRTESGDAIPGAEAELHCAYVRGGALSPQGAEAAGAAIGPLQGLLRVFVGLI